MKTYTHLSSGKFHPNHCEDFVFQCLLGGHFFVGAVMDGCSSGKESYFASSLYGKSLHKSCRVLPNMKEIQPELDLNILDKSSIGSFILAQLFEDIKKIKRTLFLDIEEILSTIILLVVDLRDNSGWVNISGDGLIVVNGDVNEIDQNNMPDYMSYHLDLKPGDWIRKHTQSIGYNDIKDISISTDGIIKLKPGDRDMVIINPVDYFLIESPEDKPKNFLDILRNNLIYNLDYIQYDDMGMIRLIL